MVCCANQNSLKARYFQAHGRCLDAPRAAPVSEDSEKCPLPLLGCARCAEPLSGALTMSGPPKAKRGPAKTALQKLQLQIAYHALDLVQAPFGLVFWKLEQLKARLQDELTNE
jgi:hypothetical protein